MDLTILNLIHGFTGKSKIIDVLGSFLADYWGYFIILAVLVIIWQLGSSKKRIYYSLFIILTVIISRGIIAQLIRFFYFKPRPFVTLGFEPLLAQNPAEAAFPSGHMSVYFALILPLFLINKRWGWYGVAAVSLMGLSRVFVGVHWPSDIIGGMAVALVSFYIVKFLFRSYKV